MLGLAACGGSGGGDDVDMVDAGIYPSAFKPLIMSTGR